MEISGTYKLELKAHQIDPSSESVREAFGNGGLVIYKEWLKKHARQRFSSRYNQME